MDICELFLKTVLHEFYQIAFRRKLYHSLEELQADLDYTQSGHIKKKCVVAERQCKRFLTANGSGKKRWDSSTDRTNETIKMELTVRSSLNYYT